MRKPAEAPLVLVVHPDADVGTVMVRLLRDGGHDVVRLSRGEGALRRIERTSRPVVLVTDAKLGEGMDGLELAGTVQRLRPATAILIAGPGCPPPTLPPGQQFLGKPFGTAEFLKRVAGLAAGISPRGPLRG
jgi:CheY-like chemotaxis protein